MDLTTLTDAELDDLRIEVATEQERRATLANAPAQVEQISRAWADASGRQDGDPWQQPAGAHDAYRQGATVTHDGKTWESLIAFNAHAPGVSGWREQSAEGGRAAWVQPAGAHDAYPPEAIVTHNGKTWQSTANANVWEPGVYGWIEYAQVG